MPSRRTWRVAMVTGASSGIGAALARELGKGGSNLVLVARRQERLQALAEELTRRYGVQAETVRCDLSVAEDRGQLARRLAEAPPDLLVHNAGFGLHGAFADLPAHRQLEMIDVNVRAVVELTHAALQGMRARGSGALLLVASAGAFQPLPYLAVYGATKAFLLHFGESLFAELRGTGVQVTTVCPGAVDTEFFDVAGQGARTPFMRKAEDVAKDALRALERGAMTSVPGVWPALMVGAGRLIPRRWVVEAAARMLRPRRGT